MIRPRRRRFSADFEHQHEIVRLLLDLDVAVAQHAKRPVTLRINAGKQLGEPDGDDRRLDRGKADRLARQPNEPFDLLGDHDEPVDRRTVVARQLDNEDERPVRDERERVRRIDRDRRQNRQQAVDKALLQPDAVGLRQCLMAEDGDLFGRHLPLQLRPAALLAVYEPIANGGDRRELLPGAQTVVARHRNILPRQFFEAGDPHHVEFVEVAVGDRQEAKPFEQRMRRIGRLVEDAFIEREPGQFTVDVSVLRRRRAAPGQRAIGDRAIDRQFRQSLMLVGFGALGAPVGRQSFLIVGIDPKESSQSAICAGLSRQKSSHRRRGQHRGRFRRAPGAPCVPRASRRDPINARHGCRR